MKKRLEFTWVLLIAAALGGCVTAKQKHEEQQELQRSITRTSDPKAVQECSFIMGLKSEEMYGSPEAQTASLVIPKPGVAWTILEAPGGYQLYSCKTALSERAASSSPPESSAPAGPTPHPAVTAAASAPIKAAAPIPTLTPAPSGSSVSAAERPKSISSETRVTSNPEAVRGCRFLASFSEYQTVSRFQEAVARAGGDVGYVVASNRDGEVIGESYRCAGQ
jgi:hypothetical protein